MRNLTEKSLKCLIERPCEWGRGKSGKKNVLGKREKRKEESVPVVGWDDQAHGLGVDEESESESESESEEEHGCPAILNSAWSLYRHITFVHLDEEEVCCIFFTFFLSLLLTESNSL